MTIYRWNAIHQASRDPRWEWVEVILRCVASVVVVIVFCYLAIQIVNATAIEDKSPTWQEQLRDRAAEWNINKAINETLPLADDYSWVNKTK